MVKVIFTSWWGPVIRIRYSWGQSMLTILCNELRCRRIVFQRVHVHLRLNISRSSCTMIIMWRASWVANKEIQIYLKIESKASWTKYLTATPTPSPSRKALKATTLSTKALLNQANPSFLKQMKCTSQPRTTIISNKQITMLFHLWLVKSTMIVWSTSSPSSRR